MKIKKEHKNFIFGEGVSRGKILAALLFGMFIAILNQTLLNVALPKLIRNLIFLRQQGNG